MAEVFENDGQDISDGDWIKYIARAGLVGFSKDAQIRRAHADDVREHGATVFLLPDQQMPGLAQATRFLENRYRIAIRAARGGPAIYMVRPRAVERVGPNP